MNRGAVTRLGARRLANVVLAVGLVLAAGTAAGAPASAVADTDPGLWYYDSYGVQEAHDAGFTGQGVKIAVIDTQINVGLPTLSDANLTIREPGFCDVGESQPGVPMPATSTVANARHGTGIAMLLAGNGRGVGGVPAQRGVAPGAEILYYAADSGDNPAGQIECWRNGEDIRASDVPVVEAFDQAMADGASFISLSFSSNASAILRQAIARALRVGVVVLVAVNNSREEPTSALAAVNGVVAVQAMDSNGAIQASGDSSDPVIDVVGPGVGLLGLGPDWVTYGTTSGTSDATPITAGFMAVAMSKYPSATPNQVLQSLIRNTGLQDHPLEKDANYRFGYGRVSLQHLLAVDPTAYPDVNPLIEHAGGRPSYDDIFGSTPSPDPDTAAAVGITNSGTNFMPLILLVLGSVVAIGSAVIVVVVLRARRTRADPRR